MSKDLLSIVSLGEFRVQRNGDNIAFQTKKDAALFIYLLHTRRPHPRDTLAEMFWVGYSQSNAQRNLRRMLSNLRHHFESYISAPRGGQVAFNNHEHVSFDVQLLTSKLQNSQRLIAHTQVNAIEDAITLYKGSFLDGFYLESNIFERWVEQERERIRRLVVSALHGVITYYIEHQRFELGLQAATTLLGIEELDEEAHRLYMILLTLSGQRAAAIRHYQLCCKLFDQELSSPLSPETHQVYEQIRDGETPGLTASVPTQLQPNPDGLAVSAPQHNLPAYLTGFVGRKAEIEAVTALLINDRARLVTIVGLGGVGKTRLAIEVAKKLVTHFKDGVYFINLANVRQADQIIQSMLTTIGLLQPKQVSTFDALVSHIRDSNTLFILDNFEHLVYGTPIIEQLLMQAPTVSMMVTSRETLKTKSAAVFALDGLAYDQQQQHSASYGDAVELFVQGAKRSDATFEASSHNIGTIQEICRLVRGMPLALELAASWVATLHVQEILTELKDSLNLYAIDPDSNEFQARSIISVFDNTWGKLNNNQRIALIRLAVCRGSFTRDACRAIADLDIRGLTELLSKSLVFRTDAYHYEIHPLLLQYLREKYEAFPDVVHQTQQRFHEYYADLVAQYESDIVAGTHRFSMIEITNIIHAWTSAINYHSVDAIEKMREGLCAILDNESMLYEGAEAFAAAVEMLENKPDTTAMINYARCTILHGYFHNYFGNTVHAYEMVRRGTVLLGELQAYELYFLSAGLLAEMAVTEAQQEEARRFIETKRELLTTESISRLGSVIWRYAKLLDIMGDTDEAAGLLQDAAAKESKQKRVRSQANVAWQYGQLLSRGGNQEQAHRHLMESLERYRKLNYKQGIAWALTALGENALALKNFDEASKFCFDALQAAEDAAVESIMLKALACLADALRQNEYLQDALLVISFVHEQENLPPDLANRATSMVEQLLEALDPIAYSSQQLRARQLSWPEVISLVDDLVSR